MSSVHPLPDGETIEHLRALAGRWARDQLDPAAIDLEQAIPAPRIAEAAALGLFGVTIPEEHGGFGLGVSGACALVEELARTDRSVATTVGLHLGLGSWPLSALGVPAAQARWLPAMASGERIASFAATEPDAGSDLSSVRTTLREAGGAWVLDGEKAYVTNAGFAGVFTVLARSPGRGGERGHAMVCVPREAPGVSVGREEKKLGLRGSSTCPVRFEDVRIGEDQILGAPGQGLRDAHGALARGRTVMAAGCAGTARAALDATVRYASERKQFGRPLLELPAVREHLARIAARSHATRALVRRTAAAIDRDEPEADHLSMAAKVVGSEAAHDACDTAVQLHGALGFLEATGVARMLRDCRVTRIFEGANEVLLVRSGAARVAMRGGDHHDGLLAPEAVPDELAFARGTFATVLDRLRRRHGLGLIRMPLVLAAIARADHALLAAGAAIEASPPDDAIAAHAARLYAVEALAALGSVGRADDAARNHDAVVARLSQATSAERSV